MLIASLSLVAFPAELFGKSLIVGPIAKLRGHPKASGTKL